MRLEYTAEQEREFRITELESILLNHSDEYGEKELDEMEAELQKLWDMQYVYEAQL